MARAALVVWALALGYVLWAGPSLGGGVVLAQASPSPTGSPTGSPTATPTGGATPSPGPAGPKIEFLNPHAAYEPPCTNCLPHDRSKLSDRFDGVDEKYHIVATTRDVPSNAIVEVYLTPLSLQGVPGIEDAIGLLDPTPQNPNVWEMYWDIPATKAEGSYQLTVRMYKQTVFGAEEVAADTINVDLEHKSEDPPNGNGFPADETVEFLWPTNDGPLGFYRSAGGGWRAVVDTFVSIRARILDIYYSKVPLGQEPLWTFCATDGENGDPLFADRSGPANKEGTFATTPMKVRLSCVLEGNDRPSQVTAVAAVVTGRDSPANDTTNRVLSEEAGNAHVVHPYIQVPTHISLHPANNGGVLPVDARVGIAGEDCLAWWVQVKDNLQRPVQGANVDLHLRGPSDQVQFGDMDAVNQFSGSPITNKGSSNYQEPQKAHPSLDPGYDCDDRDQDGDQRGGATEGREGDHNVPGSPDTKHRETIRGTGLDGGNNNNRGPPMGTYIFHLYSRDAGFAEITAWVDDVPVTSDGAPRPEDDDTLAPTELVVTDRAQWVRRPISLSFEPAGAVAEIGTCHPYVVKVRAGAIAIPKMNVDLHATGPNDALDFCSPVSASPMRSPDEGGHEVEDVIESAHPGTPKTQHTEGETDDDGNLVVGLTSPVAGDTALFGWVDGLDRPGDSDPHRSHPNEDDDVLGTHPCGCFEADPEEPSATAITSWVAPGETKLSFINPSGYGPTAPDPEVGFTGDGENVSSKQDANNTYHVVVKATGVNLPATLEILLAGEEDATTGFAKVGDATRIGESDIYELNWTVPAIDDDSATLRAQIPGTSIVANHNIVINNADNAADPDPTEPPWETLEITRPANGELVPFSRRAADVRGTASAGAEGVDIFYTKTLGTTPRGEDWIFCGFVRLPGGTAPQPFTGTCTLAEEDSASSVTGIAAITYDCARGGCDSSPSRSPAREEGGHESGDAHRIFGLEANPNIVLEPPEAEAQAETCQKFVLRVTSETGEPLRDQGVDVHVTGPGEDPDFCDPADGSGSSRNAPDSGGHLITPGQEDEGFHDDPFAPNTQHTEGATRLDGRFVFGVLSADEGDANISVWLDVNNNDVQDPEEKSDTSTMHWTEAGEDGADRDRCTITGTARGETIRGTAGRDVICAKGGNDRIFALGGNDIVKGGRGGDEIFGGSGRDRLFGRPGADTIAGGPGDDTLEGGRGRDVLDGGDGTDICSGGRGKDRARRCE